MQLKKEKAKAKLTPEEMAREADRKAAWIAVRCATAVGQAIRSRGLLPGKLYLYWRGSVEYGVVTFVWSSSEPSLLKQLSYIWWFIWKGCLISKFYSFVSGQVQRV